MPVESLGVGGWLRSLAFAAVAMAAPIVGRGRFGARRARAGFCRAHRRDGKLASRDPLALALGAPDRCAVVLALQSRSALSFDPRYRDFPFAPLTAAAVPFAARPRYAAPHRQARRGRNCRGRGAGASAPSIIVLERDVRQLAGALAARCACAACGQSCFGCGPRQAENQERHGERRQRRHCKARCRRRRRRARCANSTSDGRSRLSARRPAPRCRTPRLNSAIARAAAGAQPSVEPGCRRRCPPSIARSRVAHDKARRPSAAKPATSRPCLARRGQEKRQACRHYDVERISGSRVAARR